MHDLIMQIFPYADILNKPHAIERGLKFRIWEEEGLYHLCSENKGADQLHLCFRKCNQRSNGPVAAHLISWPSKAQNIQNLDNIW